MKELSKEAKQAIRWYLNNNHGNMKVKQVREAMRKTWGEEVIKEIKEWIKP